MKSMLLIMTIITASLSSGAYASTKSCAEQEAEILSRLEVAKSVNNQYAAEGLETALKNVKMYCTDINQKSDAVQEVNEKQKKVNRAEQALISAQNELKDAEGEGDAIEIADDKQRVQERENRLVSARAELQQAQGDYNSLSNG